MEIAATFPGLGGPHDVARLPMRYQRRLRKFVLWKAELRAKAKSPREQEVDELEQASWDAERVKTTEPV